MRASFPVLVAAVALIAACSSKPSFDAAGFSPGILSATTTYRFAEPVDPASKAVLPFVEERLASFGYTRSQTGQLLVTISSTELDRTVGAYVPDCDGQPSWEVRSGKKKLLTGSRLAGVRVTIGEASTGRLLYRSSATIRTGSKGVIDHAPLLAAAVIPTDPREAAVSSDSVCPSGQASGTANSKQLPPW